MAKQKAKPTGKVSAKPISKSERESILDRIESQLILGEERKDFTLLDFHPVVRQKVESKGASLKLPLDPKPSWPRELELSSTPTDERIKGLIERFMVVAFRTFVRAIYTAAELYSEQGLPLDLDEMRFLLLKQRTEDVKHAPRPSAEQETGLDTAYLREVFVPTARSPWEMQLAWAACDLAAEKPWSSYLWVWAKALPDARRRALDLPSGPLEYNYGIAKIAFREALDFVNELRQSESVEDGPSRVPQPRLDKQQEPETPLADAATKVDLPLSERLAHVVFGPMVADRLLQVEKARAELTDLTTERQKEIASSLEGFQDELNRFCDSFGRTFHDTEDATAVEQARAFSKDLNARLRTLGYRFIDPDTGRAATLTAFPLKKGPSDVYFALCYSSKLGTEKRQTSSVSTIPPLFLTPIQ